MDFGTAVILAGGKSSRMGFDKQLLSVNDFRLFDIVCKKLRQSFSDILVVTNRPELYAGMDVRTCTDIYRERGPLAGIHTALKHAHSRFVFLLACDMPIICTPYIQYMQERMLREDADICVTRRNGRLEPFHAFYKADLVTELEAHLEAGSSSLYRFINATKACVIQEEEAVLFDGQLGMFTNINTKSEYEAYLNDIV